MGKLWKILLLGVIVGILVLMALGLGHDSKKIPTALLDKPAPPLRGPALTGSATIDIADYKGKWVLVNFWGSWCGACVSEHPELLQLDRIAKQRDDFAIIGIDYKDTRSGAISFLQRHGTPSYAMVFDPDQKVAIEWGVVRAPESYFVNPAGKIVKKEYGPLMPGWFDKVALPLMRTHTPSPTPGAS
ncbi:periplasmic protein thiol--disulfide oxidoreductase DsbE [Magnetococcus marinus MC-1]|uniref:Periplasmic protein thiol--disulfide oxidoreductase DsbE n=1 Tax=Magnetococcus marinus (strain ATCC BAA-1437 / JCM 17883 / MC-1) TaxID=156889 RepID=A0LDE5_MAGMM|nr:DsbE family thiol:disulfide interchange protein [Magnetococcus marinus]ABK45988.1 periplasmic protein thiol--disulfide oxidoreductase DsbE [Magnetococcus marinus MC-1]